MATTNYWRMLNKLALAIIMHFPQANSPVAVGGSDDQSTITGPCCSYTLESVTEYWPNEEPEYVLLPEQTDLQSPNLPTSTVSQSTHYNVKPLHFSIKCGTFAQPYFK